MNDICIGDEFLSQKGDYDKNTIITMDKTTTVKKKPTLDDLREQIRKIKELYRDLETKNVSLRWMMKQDGIALHPNKTKLQDAIQKHNRRIQAVLLIQCIFRGFLARIFWRKFKRGNQISQCVNQTDFYTLEPLEEIDPDKLYFYKSGEHLYGFNIQSLLIYYGKSKSNNNQLLNPYNREIIPRRNIQQLLILTNLFLPQTVLDIKDKPYYRVFMGEAKPPNNVVRIVRPNTPIPPNPHLIETFNQLTPETTQSISIPDLIYNAIRQPPVSRRNNTNLIIYNSPIITGEIQRGIAEHLAEIEQLPTERRIHELFIDFDLLGNYTDARWFLHQNLRGYKVYFVKLEELWNHLPPFVQQSICCVGDPFYLVDVRDIQRQTLESMRGACLKIMEYITHGGISREDQKLGIYQILIAMTFISREARHSMNHLL